MSSSPPIPRVLIGVHSPQIEYLPPDTSLLDMKEIYDNDFLNHFKSKCSLNVNFVSHDAIQFDLLGVDAAIANAIRRILLSEIPTMAIEKAIIFQNTSIIADEVLAHRCGLIPIKANPRKFYFVGEETHHTAAAASSSSSSSSTEEKSHDDKDKDSLSISHDFNSLVFSLDVEASAGIQRGIGHAKKEEKDHHVHNNNNNKDVITPTQSVYSRQIRWHPQGNQQYRFPSPNEISVAYDDIIVAKLRGGQAIQIEFHVEKGIGKDHHKWSPVATASYRLSPQIQFKRKVTGKRAEKLKSKCPLNVFDVVNDQAVVANPRNCSMCRECIRGTTEDIENLEWNEFIELSRKRDHYLFQVETVGHYTPQDVVKEALVVLRQKARTIKKELMELFTLGNESHSKK